MGAIQKLEEKKAELIQKVEKMRLQEEKLLLEREVLEKELAELADVEMMDEFASWEPKQIEEFVQEKEKRLRVQKVRRGAIEELQDVERHYHDFQKKDQEILTLLQSAKQECSYVLREGKKGFGNSYKGPRILLGIILRRFSQVERFTFWRILAESISKSEFQVRRDKLYPFYRVGREPLLHCVCFLRFWKQVTFPFVF
ncbi:MAG: hypothetical protein ACUVQZ_04300 [Candidatus Caldatribacteriaceae bacterium]